MIETTVTVDGQALLLLCSTLGLPKGVKPLAPAEWNRVAAALSVSDLPRPADLMGQSAAALASQLQIEAALAERMASLLARGGQLALELDRLSGKGIWAVTRADAEYPARLKQRLMQQAPPVLFGAGPLPDTTTRALAIVGSRDLDDEGLAFARRLARSSAEAGIVVVSGGARGTDAVAQEEAVESGGRAWAVLADSLERTLQKRAALAPVRAGRLTLLTPFHPATPFSVGAAMGRNRLIYCLSDGAVVVSSAAGEGGTWAGALENLEREWVPLYVRFSPEAPGGNQALLQKGGRAVTREQIASAQALEAVLDPASFVGAARAAEKALVRDGLLFEGDGSSSGFAQGLPLPKQATPVLPDPPDVYGLVIDHLVSFCREPRTAGEIAEAFVLERAQVKAWLARAVKDGTLHKRAKPVRYAAATPTLFRS